MCNFKGLVCILTSLSPPLLLCHCCPALVSQKRVHQNLVRWPSVCMAMASSLAPCASAATRSSSPRTVAASLWVCCLRPTLRTSRPRLLSSPPFPSANKPISFMKNRAIRWKFERTEMSNYALSCLFCLVFCAKRCNIVALTDCYSVW